MKTILKLHPHKHTGKLLHHRHTSYPALFLLLALAGAVMLTPVDMARADSYLVNAVVPAPLPSDPAVITSPADGTTVTQTNVTIRGNCPVIDPPIIVVLYDGSTIIGSQYCASDGSFVIPISLTPGSHSIVPQVMNFTGQTGARGTPVLITYLPPVVTTTTTTTEKETVPTGSTTTSKQSTDSLPQIITDNAYILYSLSKPAVWKGVVRGGVPPYGITVDWGDGTIDSTHNVAVGAISRKHHYKQLKMYQVRIELRDTVGHVLGISIVALSPAAYNSLTAPPLIAGNTTLSRNWLLYSLYILTVVALTLFWHRERTRYAHQPVLVRVSKRQPATKTRKR